MPRIACPECDAITKVPDDAGPSVRCSGCGKKLAIPDRGSKDDEEPKRKKKKAKKGNPLVLWIVLGGVGLVVLLAGCGVGGWYLFLRKDPAMGPDGWVAMEHEGGVFTAAFPGGRPENSSFGKNPPRLNLPDGKTLKDIMIATEFWERQDHGREYHITLSTIPPGEQHGQAVGALIQEEMPFMQVVERGEVEVNGCKGKRIVHRGRGQTVVRHLYAIKNKYVLSIGVTGNEKMPPDYPDVAKFLERAKPNPNAE